MTDMPMDEADEVESFAIPELPEHYYLSSLKEICPKTMTIAFETQFEGLHPLQFPFIKKDTTRTVSGVTLARGLDWDEIDS